MASNDLYLRSDADKDETSPDKDLRLRTDSDKIPTIPAGSTYTRFNTPIGNYLEWSWNSGQFNVDSGMRATDKSGTSWDWYTISSSSKYFYPTGNYLSWIWVSGSYQGGGI